MKTIGLIFIIVSGLGMVFGCLYVWGLDEAYRLKKWDEAYRLKKWDEAHRNPKTKE